MAGIIVAGSFWIGGVQHFQKHVFVLGVDRKVAFFGFDDHSFPVGMVAFKLRVLKRFAGDGIIVILMPNTVLHAFEPVFQTRYGPLFVPLLQKKSQGTVWSLSVPDK